MCCLWCYVLARLESNVTRTCGILAQCSVELYSQISLSMRCYETECMQFLRYQCNLKRNHNFYNHCMYLIQIEKTLSDSKTLILTFFQVSSNTSHISSFILSFTRRRLQYESRKHVIKTNILKSVSVFAV